MSIHPHFTLVGIEPEIIITFQFGALDFRENIPLDVLEKLYKDAFPYLKLTKEGLKAMNPTPQPLNPSTTQPLNPSTPQPLNNSTPQPLNPSTTQPLNPSTPTPKTSQKKHAGKSK
jgi:hypothetical protein